MNKKLWLLGAYLMIFNSGVFSEQLYEWSIIPGTSYKIYTCSFGQRFSTYEGYKCMDSATAMTYDEAVKACSGLGKKLPTLDQLLKLVHCSTGYKSSDKSKGCIDGSIVPTILNQNFPSTVAEGYWTTNSAGNGLHYTVNFKGGYKTGVNDKHTYYVRCLY